MAILVTKEQLEEEFKRFGVKKEFATIEIVTQPPVRKAGKHKGIRKYARWNGKIGMEYKHSKGIGSWAVPVPGTCFAVHKDHLDGPKYLVFSRNLEIDPKIQYFTADRHELTQEEVATMVRERNRSSDQFQYLTIGMESIKLVRMKGEEFVVADSTTT